MKEGKKSIPIEYHSVPIIMPSTSGMFISIQSRIVIQREYFTCVNHDEEKIMFSSHKDDHYFNNDDIEIEFSLPPWEKVCDDYPYPIYRSVLIGAKHIETKQNKQPYAIYDSLQGYYLYWVQPPLGSCWNKGKFNEEQWEISNMTDTVITNLPYSTIKELYPTFSGIYLQKKYNHIYVNCSDIDKDKYLPEEKIRFFQ